MIKTINQKKVMKTDQFACPTFGTKLSNEQLKAIKGRNGGDGPDREDRDITPSISCGTEGTFPCTCVDRLKDPTCVFTVQECWDYCD